MKFRKKPVVIEARAIVDAVPVDIEGRLVECNLVSAITKALAAEREAAVRVVEQYADRMRDALKKRPDNSVATCKLDAAESLLAAIRAGRG